MKKLTDCTTLGELKAHGYRARSVKEELRHNLVKKLRRDDPLFPGILGFENTVIPHVCQAILGKHDFILLGLRGQAKSRLIRMLPDLLDEFLPIVAGSEINDNPFAPISKYGIELVAAEGDDTPVRWIHRSERYGEKLATPDTSIADLIGDIDPIKAAHRKLTYADEEIIHFGIIPRTNRGIFAINELPDLQARIQVGLLNIMEEQDIQIRGFNVRFPLDLLMVFTANPEDYTNRGNIITPLKDRIDSQIITHYPRLIHTAIAITRQEAWQERGSDAPKVTVPQYLREVIEQIAHEARQSEFVDQKSGVSARMTRSALEELISAAELRCLQQGERSTVARISDLECADPAITGKIELVYEGEQEGAANVARALTGRAVRAIFPRHFPDPADKKEGRQAYQKILDWFASGKGIAIHPHVTTEEYAHALSGISGLKAFVKKYGPTTTPDELPSLMGFVLEALHQNSLLGKEYGGGNSSIYSDLVGSVLSSLGPPEEEDGPIE